MDDFNDDTRLSCGHSLCKMVRNAEHYDARQASQGTILLEGR